MSRAFWWAVLAVVVLLVVLAEVTRPPAPVDWSLSLERADARPYGVEALYRSLAEWGFEVRPQPEIPFVALGPADSLHRAGDRRAARRLGPDAYLFVTDFFQPDAAETNRLLRYAARGGTVFVVATLTDGPLADTLQVEAWNAQDGARLADSTLTLTAPALARDGGYRQGLDFGSGYLEGVGRADSVRGGLGAHPARPDEVLGRVGGYARDTVFARIPYGDGAFLFHAAPLVFTNAHLLHAEGDGADYAAAVFAYLPMGTLWWDEAHLFGGDAQGPPPGALQFVRSDPSLTWALWLGTFGLLAFVLLRGRRWQRAVPEVEPPANEHARYAEAVGQLRFMRAESPAALLASRRAAFERRLAALHLDPGTCSHDDALRLARRTGTDPDDVRRLFLALTRPHPDAEHVLRAERLADRLLGQMDPDRPAASSERPAASLRFPAE